MSATETQQPIQPHKQRDYFLPILVISLGVIALLQNFGLLPVGIWHQLWRFWPVVLIISGLQILTYRHRAGGLFIVVTTLVTITAIVIYALMHTTDTSTQFKLPFFTSKPATGSSQKKTTDRVSASSYDSTEVDRIDLQLNIGAAKLKLTDRELVNWLQVDSKVASTHQVEVNHQLDQRKLQLSIDMESGRLWGFDTQDLIEVDLLQTSKPVDITLDVGAGAADIVLETVDLDQLQLAVGAGTALVDVSALATPSAQLKLDVGVGSAQVKVSAQTSFVINYDIGVGRVSVDGQPVSSGFGSQGIYTSFESNSQKPELELDVSVGTGQVEIFTTD